MPTTLLYDKQGSYILMSCINKRIPTQIRSILLSLKCDLTIIKCLKMISRRSLSMYTLDLFASKLTKDKIDNWLRERLGCWSVKGGFGSWKGSVDQRQGFCYDQQNWENSDRFCCLTSFRVPVRSWWVILQLSCSSWHQLSSTMVHPARLVQCNLFPNNNE